MDNRRQSDGRAGVRVDGDRLRSIRCSLGLTQREVARRSGYTDRFIRKLEAGGPVKLQSLHDVVQAYNESVPERSPHDLGELICVSSRMASTGSDPDFEELARRWFTRLLEDRDLTAVDDLVAENVAFFAEGEWRHGREIISERARIILGGFNPVRIVFEQVVSQASSLVVFWKSEGVHCGEFLGIPPTGRTVESHGSSYFLFRDEQIVEIRDHWDINAFFQQLRDDDPPPSL